MTESQNPMIAIRGRAHFSPQCAPDEGKHSALMEAAVSMIREADEIPANSDGSLDIKLGAKDMMAGLPPMMLGTDQLMGAVQTAREMGMVSFAAQFLKQARSQSAEAGHHEFDQQIEDHATWLSWATEYEKDNGAGSLVDRSHPVFAKVDRMDKRAQEILANVSGH
ncbi:hypothetical protein [Mesorhizobium sophorae]|uniref:hypothetical protein n=1 Tax=Mesorhizobium sophorae TaxID=1300294 RepID=UPI001180EBD6|nr:hypothetical protein [Mesorhizobium sophorae]